MTDSIGKLIFDVNRYSNHIPIDNIGMSIGSRVKEARLAAKMTQATLAKKVGISQGALSGLEIGDSQGTTLLASMAAALGVSALWLETGKGPREAGAASGPLSTSGDEATGFLELRAETAAELRLLSIYRIANERERAAIDSAVERVRRLIEERLGNETKRA